VDTTSDLAVAESHSLEPARWRQTIDLVTGSFAGRFTRVEPRRASVGFVTGLLADLQIKTSGNWRSRPDTPPGCDAAAALPDEVGRRRPPGSGLPQSHHGRRPVLPHDPQHPGWLAAVAHPTLILAWETDPVRPVHPVTTARYLQSSMPDATLHVSGTVDDVRTWANRIDEFLS
jgi:pimeloyl-ACP methyl ester carboxylesterase